MMINECAFVRKCGQQNFYSIPKEGDGGFLVADKPAKLLLLLGKKGKNSAGRAILL